MKFVINYEINTLTDAYNYLSGLGQRLYDKLDEDDPYGLNENSKYHKAYKKAENILKAYNIIYKASCIVDSKYEYTIY